LQLRVFAVVRRRAIAGKQWRRALILQPEKVVSMIKMLVFAVAVNAVAAASFMPSRISAVGTPAVRYAPNDPLVWLNTKWLVFHTKNIPLYGRTKDGKFACTSQAEQLGARLPTLVGQGRRRYPMAAEIPRWYDPDIASSIAHGDPGITERYARHSAREL